MLRGYRKFIGIALTLLLLNGCSKETPVITVSDVIERSVITESMVKMETVGMYIDVTPSMAGFLKNFNSSDPTLYSLCLNKLGLLLTSKYDDIIYYRVDTPLWRVDGTEDVLEQARNTSYYYKSEAFPDRGYLPIGEKNGYESKCLTAALNHGTNEDLFILVTDFYENSTGKNANANALAAQIRTLADRNDGKVFGLIGVKSVFSGKIYDIGPDGKSVIYGKDCLSYRPFYILIRGYPEHVQDFCQSMESHLRELGAKKGEDYEVTVFHEEYFWPLDYASFKECANPITNSKKRKNLWLENIEVNVSTSESEDKKQTLPVYGYKLNTSENFGGILYFTYSVERTYQEQFHALVDKIGEKKTVDFLPGGETEVHMFPCLTKGMIASQWDEDSCNFERAEKISFEVRGLYYDKEQERLYVALQLADDQLAQGLWRFQWSNILEKWDIGTESWWQSWHDANVKNPDYSKTDRLNDYVTPIVDKAFGTEQSIINAVVYLNIEGG